MKITIISLTNINKYYLFSFLKDCAFFSGVLIPFYTVWGHISLTQVQLLQSWFALWIFILEVPTGAIADYLGRKYTLVLGSLAFALSVVIYGSTANFGIFLVGEFLGALGIALMSGADNALLYDSLVESGKEAESKKIFGRAYSYHMTGIMVAAPIGSLIASKWGLNMPMILSVIPFTLASAVALSFKEPKIDTKQDKSKQYFKIIKEGFAYFKNHKTLRSLAFDAILVASAGYFVIWLNQSLLLSLKVPVAFFGMTHALMVLAEILVASNFHHLEKLLGSGRNYLKFSALVTGLSFILVALYPNIITVLFFIVLAGGFGLTRMELMNVYLNQLIQSDKRATVLSSISMFRRLALVLLNPLVGFMADHSLRVALLMIAILPICSFFLSPLKQEILGNKVTGKLY